MIYDFQPQDVTGKGVIVTGGTTGIGRAIAIRLLSAGAKVLVFGRHQDALEEALVDLNKAAEAGGGQVFGLAADQSEIAEVKRVFAEADAKLGQIDILVNNAAEAAQSIADTPIEEVAKVININLLGYMACASEAIERMKRKQDGHIINIGSVAAHSLTAGSDIYVATKAAIQGWTEALHKKVSQDGLKVTVIEPGLVGSDMTSEKVPPVAQPSTIAAEKMLKAEDIAELVYYMVTQPKRVHIAIARIEPRMESE